MIKIENYANIPLTFFEPRNLGNNVHDIVDSIIQNVRANGDKALLEYSQKFDQASPSIMEIPEEDLKKAEEKLKKENPELYNALFASYGMALNFATEQKKCFTDFEIELSEGLYTGQKNIPVERAGLYVPAGKFPLLSTVIMCAAPAQASGCSETVLCTPPRLHPDANGDKTSPAAQKPWADPGIMAAASICGIKRVFACGGAQAIAAMAYGTESIPRCDVIVGPGNKFVAEAKRSVYGQVGIDMVAGPTEVLIIADESANPTWVAADMLAQAEHDVDAQSILVTTSKELAQKVAAEIEVQLKKLDTATTAQTSIEKNGIIIVCNNFTEAAEIANRKAPEHLELAMNDGHTRKELEKLCRNFGSLFIGHESAEVLGDYAAGLNHTLPTSGNARYSGGLSVRMFLKTVTTLRTKPNKEGLMQKGTKQSAEIAEILGKAEGLIAHSKAATYRLQK